MIKKKKQIEDIIKPPLLRKLRVKNGQVPNFLTTFDKNNEYQAEIWSHKTYKVNPKTHVFTTIQERFGNRLLKSFKLHDEAVVVDIGCFIGEKLWQFKDCGNYLGIGVDIALPSVKAAQEIDVYNHKFIAADMEELPFKDNSVDLCVVFDVIEHLSDVKKGFSEMSRIIKPGGKLLIHGPIKDNKYSFFWWKQQLFPKQAKKDYEEVGHTPSRILKSSQIKTFLKKYGFRIEKEIYYNSFFVHFWDREFFKLLALASVKLFRSGKTVSKQSRTTHTGGLGKTREIYGKYAVPILEIISLPDRILSKAKIGNTYFCLAKKDNSASQFNYYESNKKYSNFLDQGKPDDFKLYIDEVLKLSKYAKDKSKFLDVGCGTGIVVNEVAGNGIDAVGVEVGKTSIDIAKKNRKGKFYFYKGDKLPFEDNTFTIVGSFDVLEHVDDVERFLEESVRVLNPNGYFIIGAPNFLSISSSYHYRTSGLARKVANLFITLRKFIAFPFSNRVKFAKFPAIIRDDFQPDDDAVNLINLLDVIKWGRQNNLKLITFHGAILPHYLSYKLRNIPLINLLLGGVFVVFQKKDR